MIDVKFKSYAIKVDLILLYPPIVNKLLIFTLAMLNKRVCSTRHLK